MGDLREGLQPAAGSHPEAADAFDERGRLRLRRRRRHRIRRRALVVAALLLMVGTLYSTTQLFLARNDLHAARAELTRGVGALPAGQAENALESFDIARSSARSAEARLSDPVLRLAASVPWLGRSVATTHAVAGGAALVAEAGAELAAAAITLPEGVAALAPQDGRIPAGSIAAVAPALDTAHGLVATALETVAASPSTGLARPVANARADLLSQLTAVEPQLETAAAISGVLPAFLGDDRPKRYFFGAQNPAELRGTGGFIGAYTVLTIDDGHLDFGRFRSIVDLSPTPVGGVEPPSREYQHLYGWAGGAGFGQSANLTPDVPSAAVALQRLYERVEGQPLDGAILADPHAFAALLRVAGPVEIDHVGEVTADTVVDQVANEAYALLPDSHARKELLGEVASATLTRFLAEGAGGNPVRAAEALIGVTGAGHLRLHADDDDIMEAFDVAGVTGRLDAPHDLLAVVGNNAAQNKLDFYTDREVFHEVWLREDGDAVAETTVRLRSDAPTEGLPLDVIGPNVGYLRAGENRTLLTVFCGRRCTREGSWRGDEEAQLALDGTELGYRVVGTRERYASGETAEVTHRFHTRGAWDPEESRYHLRVLDQPTIRPTTLHLTVHAPDGTLVREATAGAAVSDHAVTWRGELAGTLDVEASFGPPARSAWRQFTDFLRSPALRIGN